MMKYDNLRHELSLLLMLQVLLVGCATDDDPTDEWVGTWNGVTNEDRFRDIILDFRERMFEQGIDRERWDLLFVEDGKELIEETEEFTFDNNSRWGYRSDINVGFTSFVKEKRNDPDIEVRHAVAGYTEVVEQQNDIMDSITQGLILLLKMGLQ